MSKYKCKRCKDTGHIKQTTPIILRIPVAIFFGMTVLMGMKVRQPGKVETWIKCPDCK